MERMKEQVAEIFKQLEDAMVLAEREFLDIDAQFREMAIEHEEAYQKFKKAKSAFEHIDALQGLIEELETSE